MKIVITGSSSAIGRHLVRECLASGHEVLEFAGSSSSHWKLGDCFPRDLYADVLIHLAHDRKMGLQEHNNANLKLAKSFDGYKIYMSSISAHRQTKSTYGQIKLTGEEFFSEHNGGALRAGIVFGEEVGGIYSTLKHIVSSAKYVPLPFRGNSRMFTTHVSDLCNELIKMAESGQRGIVFAANPQPQTFRSLVLDIADPEQQIKLIEISNFLTNTFLLVAKVLKIRMQIVDSLRSLQCEVSATELSELVSPTTVFRRLNQNQRENA